MALDEISRLENIQVPAYQVEEQVQSLKDQATKAGQTDEFDDEQVRKKVESTLERRMVFDFLAEHADLEVEYMKEGEDEFDAALMEKLAQESLEREQASEGEHENADSNNETVAAVEPIMEAEPVAEVVDKAVEADSEQHDVKVSSFKYNSPQFDNMDQGEKAFNILVDLGMVEVNPDPDAPDFDASLYGNEEE
jgi:hypothetical protein